MDAATLQRFIEDRRRIDGEAQADLVAFRRGMLSVDEAISRGMGRQFERMCLGMRIAREALPRPLPGGGEDKEKAPVRVEAATRAWS